MAKKFSPPYGDGTWTRSTRFSYYEFSPPYGDGTYAFQGCLIQTWFSPPYGDGTLNISQNIVKRKS